jgi:hypothetical protein
MQKYGKFAKNQHVRVSKFSFHLRFYLKSSVTDEIVKVGIGRIQHGREVFRCERCDLLNDIFHIF